MNEEMLRAMIRESVARHLHAPRESETSASACHAAARQAQPLPFSAHPSHFRYTLPESGGPCYIEAGTNCTHCGYCESHGH